MQIYTFIPNNYLTIYFTYEVSANTEPKNFPSPIDKFIKIYE